MVKITIDHIPAKSIIIKDNYDYYDSYSGIVQGDFPIESAAKAFFQTAPTWVENLLKLRNKIVKVFGLKVSDVPNDPDQILNAVTWERGQQIGLFRIFIKTENEIILGEDDKHLNFRISFFKDKTSEGIKLILTTTVTFNNAFGKIYFIPVKVFHKPVVKAMLRNIIKELSGDSKLRA